MERYGPLRKKNGEAHRVTYAELFFDLVFVLAIIVLSHRLVENLSVQGIFETVILLLVVWWVWIYTCWATNWLNPQNIPVRLMLFGAMSLSILLTISINDAFGSMGLLFAISYVVLQAGRSFFMLWAFPKNGMLYRGFRRIGIWFLISGCFWIGGAFADYQTRVVLWIIALAIDYAGPYARFWLPGQERNTTKDWNIEGGHMAERAALFVIIAIGETILVIGQTIIYGGFTYDTLWPFSVTFFGTIALWWIYFNIGAERGSLKIMKSDDPAQVARLVYTYFHILIIAGVIFFATADELILAHPYDQVQGIEVVPVVGGPLLFLIGNILFKRYVYGFFPQSHLIGIALLVLVSIFYPSFTLVYFGATIVGILLIVAYIETYAACTKKL